MADAPSDMVAAAADVIVLNGRGVANLPSLVRLAHRTRTIITQNLALALASVAVATLPTVAGLFPLWLAVLLHEGATLLVALNSLRLLLDESTGSGPRAVALAALHAIRGMFAEQAATAAGAAHSHAHAHAGGHQHAHVHPHEEHEHGHQHDHDHGDGHRHCSNDSSLAHTHEHGNAGNAAVLASVQNDSH